jgi:dihydroorotate dehydrogenase (fumarate)
MDLSTTYLGFELPHPFMPGACPLADDLDAVRTLEDAGAPLVVLTSLFEEQIEREGRAATEALDHPKEQFAEALSYLPEPDGYRIGPEDYLDKIRRVRAAVSVPVVASLNGTTPGGWLDYARGIEAAGADAVELNLYRVPTDPERSGVELENESIETVRRLKAALHIPLAVKLSPFYSSLPHFARSLDRLGVDGLVLFNRFYQPDIDIEELEMVRRLRYSESSELPLRLRWTAILSGRVAASLAVTGGVHTAEDAIKAVMAGAHAVQLVSALLRHGPRYLSRLGDEVIRWMEEHEYESIAQMRGSMSLERCPDPAALIRANYMAILQNWRDSLT